MGNFYKSSMIDNTYNHFLMIRTCLLRILGFKGCCCPYWRFNLSNWAIQKSQLVISWSILSDILFDNRNHWNFWYFILLDGHYGWLLLLFNCCINFTSKRHVCFVFQLILLSICRFTNRIRNNLFIDFFFIFWISLFFYSTWLVQ